MTAGGVNNIVPIVGMMVDKRTKMPTWDQDDARYHINLTTTTFHVTKEGNPKIQYYFKMKGLEIVDAQPTPEERGGPKATKKKFSDLPDDVQAYVRANYAALTS